MLSSANLLPLLTAEPAGEGRVTFTCSALVNNNPETNSRFIYNNHLILCPTLFTVRKKKSKPNSVIGICFIQSKRAVGLLHTDKHRVTVIIYTYEQGVGLTSLHRSHLWRDRSLGDKHLWGKSYSEHFLQAL